MVYRIGYSGRAGKYTLEVKRNCMVTTKTETEIIFTLKLVSTKSGYVFKIKGERYSVLHDIYEHLLPCILKLLLRASKSQQMFRIKILG